MLMPEVKGCLAVVLDLVAVHFHILAVVELCVYVFICEIYTEKNSLKSIFFVLILVHSLFSI